MLQYKLPENLSKYDFKTILKEAEIVKGQTFPKPKALLTLKKEEKQVTVLSAGNLSAIQGKAKSRKTFFMCLASYIISQQNNLEIVIFDTEMSDYHSALTRHRIDKLNETIKLKFFRLRKYTRDINLDFINDYITRYKPGMVFIDNIRDCMININSNEETTAILKVLKQIIDEYGTHVCVTLHENPYKDNDKARGVIGTELQNACETIFKVEKDDMLTKVSGFFTRNGDFNDLHFKINGDGIPEFCDGNSAINFERPF
jgi:hypothetical protein